jgi:hypothetical protein
MEPSLPRNAFGHAERDGDLSLAIAVNGTKRPATPNWAAMPADHRAVRFPAR